MMWHTTLGISMATVFFLVATFVFFSGTQGMAHQYDPLPSRIFTTPTPTTTTSIPEPKAVLAQRVSTTTEPTRITQDEQRSKKEARRIRPSRRSVTESEVAVVQKPKDTAQKETAEVSPVPSEEDLDVEKAQSPVDDEAPDYETALEREVHRLTNEVRERNDLPLLAYDDALADIAKQHSADMLSKDYFDHVTPMGCDLACRLHANDYAVATWAENIAWRSDSDLPDPHTLAKHFFDNWMDSKGHRENILSEDVTHEGIGAVRDGDEVYITADFALPE